MNHLYEMVEIVSQKYFILGFISGFLYGGWVAWSLSGKTAKA